MIIVSNSKMGFATADVLAPSDLSQHYDYLNDAIKDVAGQRYARTPLVYQLVQDANTPLTDSDYTTNPERCRIRFTVPAGITAEIERVFCSANYSASAGVDGYLLTSDNSSITNLINPIFTLPTLATVSDTATNVLSVQSITCSSGRDYIIELRPVSGGTFSLERCDLTLHIKTDVFNFAATDNLDDVDYRFTEADPPDATRVASLNASVTTAVSAISSQIRTPLRPCLFAWNNIAAATSANQRQIPIPRASTARACLLDKVFLYGVFTANATATLTNLIQNEASVTRATITASVVNTTLARSGETAVGLPLVGTTGAVDPADDFRTTITTSAGTAFKVYGLYWFR